MTHDAPLQVPSSSANKTHHALRPSSNVVHARNPLELHSPGDDLDHDDRMNLDSMTVHLTESALQDADKHNHL